MAIIQHLMDANEPYQIIYADPPWRYGGSGGTKWAPASQYYPVLSFEQLAKLYNAIDYLADPAHCLLFLWVVNPALDKCIDVGKAWGFSYITTAFFWYKERANVGNYTMPQVEQCLLFKRGKIPPGRVRNPGVKSFYSERVSGHSRKPDEFAKRIEQLFPLSRRIELFARIERQGWDSYGFELGSAKVG